MTVTLDWPRLRATYEEAHPDGEQAGRVRVSLGHRRQWVDITMESSGDAPVVVRLSSPIMSRPRALETLILPIRSSEILAVDEDDEPEHEDEPPASSTGVEGGLRLLSLLAHNDRLRGIHLHLSEHELLATSDIVCLSDAVDFDLLCARIDRLAQVADGMELRATGVDER